MLKEIVCSVFRNNKITFKNGLNIILGDNDAKNSIGKSSALMAIDFVHGGNSLLEDNSGAIYQIGHHSYKFSFIFNNKKYSYSRSTSLPDVVEICDENYIFISEIEIEDYRKQLKELYHLNECLSSFRNLVSPFSRIWGKGNLEPQHPFVSVANESQSVAIYRLIDLFNFSDSIAEEKLIVEKLKGHKKIIVNSMNAEIIPNVNRAKYKENQKLIIKNTELIEQLKSGFSGALAAYEILFDENIAALKTQKDELTLLKSELQSRVIRLERESKGITPRLTANISLVKEFFPNINVERLEQVQAFHHKISGIVKKQIREELANTLVELNENTKKILDLGDSIQYALKMKGMPDDLFEKLFELKGGNDRALTENSYFDQKDAVEKSIKASNERLFGLYGSIFITIENKLNLRLKAFNKVVYGARRSNPELSINRENSYSFLSRSDTGTGKCFADLIGFDLAMLATTNLPYIIHDSVIYKNIEVEATKKIIRILASVKAKQIFISFDESKKFGAFVEDIIDRNTVLKLSNTDLLYNKDWRER